MRVKFGLQIPTRLGEMAENLGGGGFLTHAVVRLRQRQDFAGEWKVAYAYE